MMGRRVLALAVLVLALPPVTDLAKGAESPSQGNDPPASVYRSPNHICVSRDGLYAYVVNQTADSVSVLDVRTRQVTGEIKVGRYPAHAVLSPDGGLLYVTCHHGSAVDVVDLERRRVVRSMGTGFGPYGLTVSDDGQTLYVANTLSDTISIIDVESGETRQEVPVGRGPRFVRLVPHSSKLIVSCSLARGVWILDADQGRLLEVRDLDRGNLLRQIACSADGRWAFVTHILSHDELAPLQMERGLIHSNGFSVLDLRRPDHRVTLLLDRLLVGAANPWGMALSQDGRRLYVSVAGVHEVAIVDLPKMLRLIEQTDDPNQVRALETDVDILERRRIVRRVDAGGIGPRGIALSESHGELLVANYFSDSVSVLDAETGDLRGVIPLGPSQEMDVRRRGEMLFNDARLCFQKWFSCASCHEENAVVDGLNWDLPNDGLGNFKNVKSLHNVHDTPPAMWAGVRDDMAAGVAAGQRFLGFLPDPENHRALLAYLESPRRPPNPYRGLEPEAAERGKHVFYRARCHTCHPEPRFTDLRKHDVGLAGDTDLRSRFDTPSLRDCYRTAPYLHDGRAPTLRDIFMHHNPTDLHGRTSNLKGQELEDLLIYLRAL